MDKKFLEVMAHEGPVTIITINAQPAGVVNTWMSYVKIDQEKNQLFIPAAGMRSIEKHFELDNTVLLTVGSKEVEGTMGPGAGFHILGKGTFIDAGEVYEEVKTRFPWVREVLQVDIESITQKI